MKEWIIPCKHAHSSTRSSLVRIASGLSTTSAPPRTSTAPNDSREPIVLNRAVRISEPNRDPRSDKITHENPEAACKPTHKVDRRANQLRQRRRQSAADHESSTSCSEDVLFQCACRQEGPPRPTHRHGIIIMHRYTIQHADVRPLI